MQQFYKMLSFSKGSNNDNTPHQEQEVEVENIQSNINAEEEKVGAVEHTEEVHEEIQPQEEEIPQQGIKTGEDEAINKINEHYKQEITEVLTEGQEQLHEVPVHRGQPEI